MRIARRTRLLLATSLLTLSIAGAARSADVHTLRAGETIASLNVELKPGDQILLEPGRHGPIELSGVRGAPGKPIVVRGSNPTVPAAIQGEEFGIRLRGVSHVVVQDIIVIGGERAAVIVDTALLPDANGVGAETPCEQITLRRIAVGRTGDSAGAFVLRHVHGARVEQCRAERFGRAGIELDACSDVLVVDPLIVGSIDPARPSGIVIGRGSERVHISGARIQGGVDVGIAVGIAGADTTPSAAKPTAGDAAATRPTTTANPAGSSTGDGIGTTAGNIAGDTPGNTAGATSRGTASPPSTVTRDGIQPAPLDGTVPEPRTLTSRIVIEQGIFRGCTAAVAIGSVEGLLLDRCTVTTPRGFLLRFGPLPTGSSAPRDVVIRDNLFVWVPNEIRTLADVRPGVDLAGVSLGRNLWWSEELGLIRDQLGPFPGKETAPQVTTVDPRMGDFDLATNPDAAGFGSGN